MKQPYRRKTGIHKFGEDHPDYAKVSRYLYAYDGTDYETRMLANFHRHGTLSYSQVDIIAKRLKA